MIILKNKTKSRSIIGRLVSLEGKDGFVYYKPGGSVVGVVTEAVVPNKDAVVAIHGTVRVQMYKSVTMGRVVRAAVSGEGAPSGTGMPIGSEVDYTSIGVAASNGTGLVDVILNIHPVSAGGAGADPLPDQTGESGNFLTTDGTDPSWVALPGGGDMLVSVYDPTGVGANAFIMSNMVESTAAKIFTSTERGQLAALVAAPSGASTSQLLAEWGQGKDYEMLVITRDADGRITSSTVKWPDAATGLYTSTNYNATHEVYDGFTITHSSSALTVTQSAVTRNTDGAITNKPALTVA